jgi:hypothetical protein
MVSQKISDVRVSTRAANLRRLAGFLPNRYAGEMRRSGMMAVATFLIASNGFSAEARSWAGKYRDENLLNGEAGFQLVIEQSGNAIQVSFDAAYKDGHGAAPDGGGDARIKGANALEFKWEDSFSNSGTGNIKRAGDAIIVSMQTTRVVDERCLAFYGDNMRLKRAKE